MLASIDTFDMLRGRVRRLAYQSSKKKVQVIAQEMGLALQTLQDFLQGEGNPTTSTIMTIESWCNRQDHHHG